MWRKASESRHTYSWETNERRRPQRCIVTQSIPEENNAVSPSSEKGMSVRHRGRYSVSTPGPLRNIDHFPTGRRGGRGICVGYFLRSNQLLRDFKATTGRRILRAARRARVTPLFSRSVFEDMIRMDNTKHCGSSENLISGGVGVGGDRLSNSEIRMQKKKATRRPSQMEAMRKDVD